MQIFFFVLSFCPAYQEKRCSLLDYLEKEYRIKISRMSPNKIFMFLINPPSGNVKIQKKIAKHIFQCFGKRKGEDGKAAQGLRPGLKRRTLHAPNQILILVDSN